ncbi:protein kinase [Streptomyces sp. M10(2022)]
MEHSQGTDTGLLLAGRYRLGEVLGRGGMGRVWRAHDEVLNRTVAVKELTAGMYVAEADRAVLHARTQKERAQPPVSPTRRRHRPRRHRVRQPPLDRHAVRRRALARRRREGDRRGLTREAARIGLHVLSALSAAHSAGVLHRDVKPGNVLLAADGQVLLTDFGIAAIEGDSTITRTGELVGSIDYLAPSGYAAAIRVPRPTSGRWVPRCTRRSRAARRSAVRHRSPPCRPSSPMTLRRPRRPARSGP